jgi:predicted Zn-dependent protease
VGLLLAVGGAYAFSRDQERDADRISVVLLRNNGYDTREAPSPTFARLRATWMFLDPSSRADVGLAFSLRLEYAT